MRPSPNLADPRALVESAQLISGCSRRGPRRINGLMPHNDYDRIFGDLDYPR